MNLATELYAVQTARWPEQGRHILAQYDAVSIVVYQAYAAPIGRFAAEHGHFGPGFSVDRMSWIKPNFLWMMYRSGWGTKSNQEVVLAIRIQRAFFDGILRAAVHTTFAPEVYASREEWQEMLAKSPVRLQWDPDHGPSGERLQRRAIQLGLSSRMLASRESIIEIQDISAFVEAQRELAASRELLTPREEVYVPEDASVVSHIGLDMERKPA